MKKLTKEIVEKEITKSNKLWRKIVQLIKNDVREKGAYEISIDDEDYCPCIAYLGGHHSEYASNCSSMVQRIEWSEKDDDVLIYTEDGIQRLEVCFQDDAYVIAEIIAFLNEKP